MAERDAQGFGQLCQDLDNLLKILNVVIKKYRMPEEVKQFIKDMQQELFACREISRRGAQDVTRAMFKVKDNYNAVLNSFFHFGENHAPWWNYYIMFSCGFACV